LKRNSNDDDFRYVHIDELRSRIDEGFAFLDRGEGIDGEKFMQGMLGGLESREARRKLDAARESHRRT
jgi:hypothetical protein